MLAVRSKNGVYNVGGKVVENSPESHKPVEIGDYTASDDSEIGDTPERVQPGAERPLTAR